MTREIKFRAWDTERKLMLHTPISIATIVARFIREFRPAPTGFGSRVEEVKPDDYILMQFTGLLDSKGKEIYEGDILQSVETDEVYRVDEMLPAHRHDHSTNIGYFTNGKYKNRNNPDSRYTGDDWMSWPEMYKIIGNIYENPELL